MVVSIKKFGSSLALPGLLILCSCILAAWWPDLIDKARSAEKASAFLELLPLLPHALFGAGMILGWRYSNTGMILASLSLSLAYAALARTGGGPGFVQGAGAAFLLPLNLVFFSFLTKRRLLTALGLTALGVVILEILAVWILCEPALSRAVEAAAPASPDAGARLQALAQRLHAWFSNPAPLGFDRLPLPGQVTFCWALLFLAARTALAPDPLLPGFLGALTAAFIGAALGSPEAHMIFFSTAGLILLVTAIEASFSMAYIDELTGLPGRRSLNETMINLGRKYVIAMIDIDHFKKFNDTYGHKTGDQVLRMIATKLSRMGGGAKTFRYGGEEFTAIFPGKEMFEALPHIEKYRQAVEKTPFIVRSKGRKKTSANSRGKGPGPAAKKVQVTVSIGVSEPQKGITRPEQVMKAADKVLYKAKKSGRNCVKT